MPCWWAGGVVLEEGALEEGVVLQAAKPSKAAAQTAVRFHRFIGKSLQIGAQAGAFGLCLMLVVGGGVRL